MEGALGSMKPRFWDEAGREKRRKVSGGARELVGWFWILVLELVLRVGGLETFLGVAFVNRGV